MTYSMLNQATVGKPAPLLFGLYSPKPGQGKTAAALALQKLLSGAYGKCRTTTLRPIATPLKLATAAVLEQALGMSDINATRAVLTHKDVPLGEGVNFTGRDAVCWIGEGAREMFGPDVWVDRTFSLVDRDMRQGFSVIIDDIRRENEAAALFARRGHLIRITRDGDLVGIKSNTEGRLNNYHFDLTIHNVGTTADLSRMLRNFVKEIDK